MKIQKVSDASFRQYGRIISEIDFTELVVKMQEKPCPQDVVYVASDADLEALEVSKKMQTTYYGELPVQVGYCNGNNYLLNAVEYHRSSEVNVAATDMILLLGRQQDITDDYTLDTSKMEAFWVPKGVGVELYATTLHYAPCNALPGGFRVAVLLPKGTNEPLDTAHAGYEDALITAKNKWLIGHAEGGLDAGAHIGLIGENLDVRKMDR